MVQNRFALFAIACLIAAASGGFLHRSGVLTYASWHDALAGIPCQKVEKVGNHLKIVGPIVVDGQTYQERTITEHDQVEELERRCFPRHG